MHDRLTIMSHAGKQVLTADFTGFKEEEMLVLMRELVDLLIENRSIARLLVIHKHNYLTPNYMKELRSYRKEERNYKVKTAMFGLNLAQKMILKGYNIFENRDVREFKTKEEAMQFLLSD